MIRHIYFDLGGVVIIDFAGTNKSEELKHDLGLTGKNAVLFDDIVRTYSDKYDFNIDYDIDKLLPVFEKELNLKFPKDYSFLHDIVQRFDQNPSIWPLLKKAKETYRLGLLTNMFPRMFKSIKNRKLLPPIAWDVVVDSSAVGLQKPNRDIFELAQKLSKANNDEILFVDNSMENVTAADHFGWRTLLYDPTHPKESNKKLEQMLLH